ncbi:MAG: IS200/IS605 family transposase [Candidatus Cloacimonadaceae bacterium]
MPDSYCYIATHIIFSTKERFKFFHGEHHHTMHQYIAGIIKNVNGFPIIINGTNDHIHILALLPKEMTIAEFVRTIKSNSSKWFRTTHNPKFGWQQGYAAFSVSRSRLDNVIEYIRNQEAHHKTMSFEEEYKKYIEKHGFVNDQKDVSPLRG